MLFKLMRCSRVINQAAGSNPKHSRHIELYVAKKNCCLRGLLFWKLSLGCEISCLVFWLHFSEF